MVNTVSYWTKPTKPYNLLIYFMRLVSDKWAYMHGNYSPMQCLRTSVSVYIVMD